MNYINRFMLATVGLTLLAGSSLGQGLTLNFANNTGAPIQFNGTDDSFQFNTASSGAQSGFQWHITTESGGSSAANLLGSITGGPFNYGSISSSGSGITLTQSASVTGSPGSLVIYDGVADDLTGTVSWGAITTYSTTLGVLNTSLAINVTDLAYSGSNPDLQYIVAQQPGTLDLSFQFSPGQTLSSLSQGSGSFTTSYSGCLTVVPEPSILALAGLGGLVFYFLLRKKITLSAKCTEF